MTSENVAQNSERQQSRTFSERIVPRACLRLRSPECLLDKLSSNNSFERFTHLWEQTVRSVVCLRWRQARPLFPSLFRAADRYSGVCVSNPRVYILYYHAVHSGTFPGCRVCPATTTEVAFQGDYDVCEKGVYIACIRSARCSDNEEKAASGGYSRPGLSRADSRVLLSYMFNPGIRTG